MGGTNSSISHYLLATSQFPDRIHFPQTKFATSRDSIVMVMVLSPNLRLNKGVTDLLPSSTRSDDPMVVPHFIG